MADSLQRQDAGAGCFIQWIAALPFGAAIEIAGEVPGKVAVDFVHSKGQW